MEEKTKVKGMFTIAKDKKKVLLIASGKSVHKYKETILKKK